MTDETKAQQGQQADVLSGWKTIISACFLVMLGIWMVTHGATLIQDESMRQTVRYFGLSLIGAGAAVFSQRKATAKTDAKMDMLLTLFGGVNNAAAKTDEKKDKTT